MTLLDIKNVFTGTSGGAAVVQDLQNISAATNSTDILDVQANGLLLGGRPLKVHIGGIEESVAAASNVTTLEVQAVGYVNGYPRGSHTGKTASAADTDDLITLASHGLEAGTRVTISSVGTSGLSASLDYYVLNPTSDTFQLSATPGGSVAAVTGNSSIDIDIEPIILGTTGPLPQAYYQTDSTVTFSFNLQAASNINQKVRYVGLLFIPGAALHATTGGQVKAWMADDSGTNLTYHAANSFGVIE